MNTSRVDRIGGLAVHVIASAMKPGRSIWNRSRTTAAAAAVLALLLLSFVGSAQDDSTAARVRALNSRLLQVYERLQNTPAGGAAAIRSEGAGVIAQREAVLEALIEQNPGEALRLAFPDDVLARLASAFPNAARRLETFGTWEGPIEYLVADDFDTGFSRNILDMETGGEILSIYFAGAEPRGLETGLLLRVHGVRAGTAVSADNGTVNTTGASGAAGAAGRPKPGSLMCSKTGNQSTIVLLVTMPGVPPPTYNVGDGHTLNAPDVWNVFFAPISPATEYWGGLSVSEYWREASYGATWATGDVQGWYMLDKQYSCNDRNAIRTAAIKAAGNVDFTKYTRIFILVHGMTGDCTWGGVGTLGCGTLSSGGSSFNASTSWIRADMFTTLTGSFPPGANGTPGVNFPAGLAIHEGGHNLELGHGNSRAFGEHPLGAPGDEGVITELRDLFSTMAAPARMGHYSAPHKAQLGWSSAETDIRTVTAGGSYSVQPFELPGSVRALKIQRGNPADGNWIWLEYRQPVGNFELFDFTQVFDGALIHYEDSYTGVTSHLLDFTPLSESDFLDPALTGSWTDPWTGVSIAITGRDSNGLGVNVTYGPMTCVETHPAVSISPSTQSAAPGSSADYTVTVRNNDSAACSAKTFTLSSQNPAGWATGFSPSDQVTIAPGQSASVTMTKFVPTDADTAVTVAVDATATSGSFSGTGAANCTVMYQLDVTVSTPSAAYPKNSTVPITAVVQRGGTAVAGASVTFTVKPPTGASATSTVTTDSQGQATWNYAAGGKAGLYMVTALAASGSETATSTTTFTVQ
jgi:M6 family metalloprotease-like protein